MQPTTPTVFPEIPIPQPDENRYAHDSRLVVEFFRKPVHMEAKSREAGRAIYEEVDYLRIYTPGDKSSVIERPVNVLDEQRFADRYSKWKAGQEQAQRGPEVHVLPTGQEPRQGVYAGRGQQCPDREDERGAAKA
jgi:hypothetical protein